jgi:cell wall-associated NlpC family hydrolase
MKKRIISAALALVLLISFIPMTAFASPAAVVLKKGSSGASVKALQEMLNANGYTVTVDGKFGASTQAAVKRYQANCGLKADGIAGSKTLARLKAVENFITTARSKLGVKYVRGGKGPDKFDCSGFVYWSLNHSGIKQSYMTSSVWQKSTKYKKIADMKDMVRGDIISLKGHVAIYLGNGQAINALGSTHSVSISSRIFNSSYWTKNFVCGFRVF